MSTKKIDLQQTNLARQHLAYSSLNLLVQQVCGFLLGSVLSRAKIRSRRLGEINIAVKMFKINVFNFIKTCWRFFKTAITNELYGGDIDISKNISSAIYDLCYLLITISVVCWLDGIKRYFKFVGYLLTIILLEVCILCHKNSFKITLIYSLEEAVVSSTYQQGLCYQQVFRTLCM